MAAQVVATVEVLAVELDAGPGGAAVGGAEQAAGLGHGMSDAAEEEARRVEGIDDDDADAARDAKAFGSGEQLPGLAAVERAEQADAGMRVGGEVGFAGAAIDGVGLVGIERQRADVEGGLLVPQAGPGFAAVAAGPDAAASRAGPETLGMERMRDNRRHAPADVGRPRF